ncbi:hypothetical protein RDI58_030193 [Solanum bulbocastanum]|uniref:Uncharacterized protein n=1 Tax=Solanum bulbocastanum TaxID=147425 RepID=A0AAN8SMV7_SOLBU
MVSRSHLYIVFGRRSIGQPFSSYDPILSASAEYSDSALAASSVSSHYSNDPEADLSFVFVVARPYLASFPELTSPTTFLYAIRRSQSAQSAIMNPALH